MKESEGNAQRLMRDFQRMVRGRYALFHSLLSEYDVTMQQFHLLMFMQESGKVTVTDLGNMMLVSMPTASRMLNTLCNKGFVVKRRDGSDRRLIYAELTKEGQRVVREVHDMQLHALARLLDKVSAGEIEVFLATMEKIADELTYTLMEDQPGSGHPGKTGT
jgi:DNA-binding MarR family transcriptional regulator